ncbi:hypothetical protein EW146_g8586 [Bondarzewia mesenterica]|uniref:Uncharacterized protein n=1 Tax=Bondarzewia mesenterica TaxID=1095465 RepID=A0A4S4LF01_9AGAM|nr:hypothetical protein EW146_g8586 [Bondarzewia mesenterica]
MVSSSTLSTSSAPTITPSLFARTAAPTPPTPPPGTEPDLEVDAPSFVQLPRRPERRPKLFFASAKTGVGVDDIFSYVTRRVVERWEWEEAAQAQMLHIQEASGSTIRLGRDAQRQQARNPCCGS